MAIQRFLTDIDVYFSKHDQQNNNEIFALVFSLMYVKRCDHIALTYNEIIFCQWGGITLTQSVLDEIIAMSCNIINELKNFLKIFESKGLTQIQIKNNLLHLSKRV